jgi:uncharacterized UPF0160 family protein
MVTVATHNGKFHLDDVFAVAAIKLLVGEDVEVIRTRNQELINSADYAVDIGLEYDPSRKRFDHHQEGRAGERQNGIPYAAFGLVWKEYGVELCGGDSEVAERIDRFVQGIDALDNGITLTEDIRDDVSAPSLHGIVAAFRPTWKESEALYDEAFNNLYPLAALYLERMIRVSKDGIEGDRAVEKAYAAAEDKRIIILDKNYFFYEVLARYAEPLFAVYPDPTTGMWRVKAVRVRPEEFALRKELPASWAGKRDEELQEISGVSDAVFVHNSLFLGGTKSKEGAIKLAQIAVESE